MNNRTQKENISKYAKWKTLHKMNKKRSPNEIVFLQEPKEDWLVEVFTYKRKSGDITQHSIITENDVSEWLERSQRLLGFEITE